MKAADDRFSTADRGSAVWDLLRGILLFAWCIVRAPILVVLAFLEPFVRVVLNGIAVLCVVTALVFRASAVPNFPFWLMLGVALVCLMLVPAYHWVFRLLAGADR